MKKYKVTGYQIVRADNQRDTITLMRPVFVDDIEAFRKKIWTEETNCRFVNLNYTTLIDTEEESHDDF